MDMSRPTSSPIGTTHPLLLVVDGDILVRTAIAEYLRNCGYKVIEAANSDEALVILDDAGLAIDVVLSVAMIGGSMNGFALAQYVRIHRPELDIVLAGNLLSKAGATAELCDTGPKIARPYDPQKVVEHVKLLMRARQR
jgi:DNA-binding response OmpR family regulator